MLGRKAEKMKTINHEEEKRKMSSITTGTTPLSSEYSSFPELMTEEELILFLRIPSVSNANDHHNVIMNLIRMHDLPRIKICKKRLYPRKAILEWIEEQTIPKK